MIIEGGECELAEAPIGRPNRIAVCRKGRAQEPLQAFVGEGAAFQGSRVIRRGEGLRVEVRTSCERRKNARNGKPARPKCPSDEASVHCPGTAPKETGIPHLIRLSCSL